MRAPMTPERLAGIRERLAAATPGPWVWRNNGQALLMGAMTLCVMAFERMGMQGAQPSFRNGDGLLYPVGKEDINAHPDAALIAHAPADLADLVAEVERLQARIEAPRRERES